MKDLIEALTIFLKYEDGDVIHCEHDVMYVCVQYDDVFEEDIKRLDELSFHKDENETFKSYRFGSC